MFSRTKKAATAHLTGSALVDTNYYKKPDFKEQEFEYEGSSSVQP